MKFATFVLSFFVALSAVATALLVYEERITLHRNVVLEANLRALIKVVEGATTHCNIVCAHKEGPNQAACRVRDRAASDQLETGAANLRLSEVRNC